MVLELAVLMALASAAPRSTQAPDGMRVARLELLGPLSELELRAGESRSTWSGALASGERFELALPVAAAGPRDEQPPALRWDGVGAARFVAWDDQTSESRASAWNELPSELRSRPLALAPWSPGPRLPPAAVALALAGALGALAARGRAAWAVLMAAAGAALAGWVASGVSAPVGTRVVEVDGASGVALMVDSAHGQLHGARLDDLRWESSPQAPVLVRAVRGVAELSLSAPGGWLRRWRALDSQGRALGPDVNEWGLLSPVWRRDPDGAWRRLEAWPRGVVLGPEAGALDVEPPGWLNPALPAGSFVIVGRWADEPTSDVAAETWLRWVGR